MSNMKFHILISVPQWWGCLFKMKMTVDNGKIADLLSGNRPTTKIVKA